MVLPGPLIETWVLYSAGSLIIFLRLLCRWRMIGVRNFQIDDYIIVVAWLTYTAMTLAAHIVGSNGDIHSQTMAQRAALASGPTQDQESVIMGTKWFCIGVATYITFIWLLKLNMLFLYQRIVNGLWVEKFIMPTIGLVGITYISTLMLLFLPCRPYDRMWIVFPDQGEFCKPQSFLNLVPPLIMNLVTDLCIMAIPAPVILPVRTTIWRKLGLLILFFAGFFIMTAAVLRVVFVLVYGNGETAAIWSCREDVVAIIVGQAVFIRPLFTRCFWSRGFVCPNAATGSKKVAPGTRTEALPLAPTRPGKSKKDPFSLSAALQSHNSAESDPDKVTELDTESVTTNETWQSATAMIAPTRRGGMEG
ncbi:hypothetical protein QBC34DRAFT_451048 [Podospora aff. communis PSN243]|uniref:Rhodopsin domain-containing protein n=1 Tax=Podospora aff. communis PSN243 TaxID=3040156 RepID=A0AAV9GB46_9PEZI|nr:hypothetical protein QBC34DRAFT_451048 [Podospora aff. communis PSN243]